jgi:hypothetical protein
MSYSPAINANTIHEWIAGKFDADKIREELISNGCDEPTIAAHLAAFRKMKYAKRQFRGFIFLGLGAFLGFISCILALTNPVPELYDWILYGLTSVAMIILFLGLYFVFE